MGKKIGSWIFLITLVALLAGCSNAVPVFFTQHQSRVAVLVLGDSLSEPYRVPAPQGWVAGLQAKLRESNIIRPDQVVINSSVSGSTTEDGLKRLPQLLAEHKPAMVVIELGANDGLRRLPVAGMEQRLNTLVQLAKASKARVLLVGVSPPKLWWFVGGDFGDAFERVADENDVLLLPDLLTHVSSNKDMIQDDALHPNELAQPRLTETVWPFLLKVADRP